MKNLLRAVVRDGEAVDGIFYGDRQEIDAWLKANFDPPRTSVTVTDYTGMTVGKKHLGEIEIHWGLKLSE